MPDAKPSQPIKQTVEVESVKDKAQGVLMVGYRGADMFSKDRYALELIDEASSDLGSRFFVRIREQMGLAYYVGSSQMQGLVPGMFAFYLGTDPEKLPAVKAALLDEIRKLATDGLTTEELTRAKKKLIGQQQIANQSNDTLGYVVALDELYGLGFDHYRSLEKEVEAVTLRGCETRCGTLFPEAGIRARNRAATEQPQIETGVEIWPKSKPAHRRASSRSGSSSS